MLDAISGTSLHGLAFVGVAMGVMWIVSLVRRDASVVDPFWGPGFVLLTWFYVASSWPGAVLPRAWLLALLVTMWGARLGVFLLRRNLAHGEDRRYVAMREHWGARFWWVSIFTVFATQGLLMWVIAAPLAFTVLGEGPPVGTWSDLLGLGLWVFGFAFETIGDAQLATFKRDPANKGRVLDTGLWRFTRHPNYFGEAVLWWGYFLIAASMPGGWITIFSPVLMTLLLLKVSGVTLLEKDIAERRPAYRDYVARTSPFIPRPPRKATS